jgi:hypothetical protein
VQDRGTWHLFEQNRSSGAIGYLTPGQQERDGTTLGVGQSMDLRGSPAARSADGLLMFPPLPPDAHRCAFTAELSSAERWFWQALRVSQLLFYGLAALGARAGRLGSLARTFTVMNAAAVVGLWRFARGKQAVTW